jgi:BirA family biotin operon repressor/biotin-[acetyl-CoA-carboxylase] ligase
MGQELRDRAYAPLRLEEIQRGLLTERLGKKIHYLPEVDSTNLYARKLAEEGGLEGEVVIAETQTHGKGRMGRSWVSPPYLNLYLSVILRPRLSPVHAPQITLMSAVALAETVESFLHFPPEIKWPNDIMVKGKKLAGILTESACERDRILYVVLGIGVNLNFQRELMPETIQHSATSFMILTQKPVDRVAFARRLIQNLDRCYGDLEDRGFSFTARRWESFFRLRGKRVMVEMLDQRILGKAMGIDSDGALVLEDEHGGVRRIVAGDVIPADM